MSTEENLIMTKHKFYILSPASEVLTKPTSLNACSHSGYAFSEFTKQLALNPFNSHVERFLLVCRSANSDSASSCMYGRDRRNSTLFKMSCKRRDILGELYT